VGIDVSNAKTNQYVKFILKILFQTSLSSISNCTTSIHKKIQPI